MPCTPPRRYRVAVARHVETPRRAERTGHPCRAPPQRLAAVKRKVAPRCVDGAGFTGGTRSRGSAKGVASPLERRTQSHVNPPATRSTPCDTLASTALRC
jgi:hypothetical protein